MSAVIAHTHRFRLTEVLTLRQKRALEAAVEQNRYIEVLHLSRNGHVVEFKLTDAADELVGPGNYLRAFLGDRGIIVEYAFPARQAA